MTSKFLSEIFNIFRNNCQFCHFCQFFRDDKLKVSRLCYEYYWEEFGLTGNTDCDRLGGRRLENTELDNCQEWPLQTQILGLTLFIWHEVVRALKYFWENCPAVEFILRRTVRRMFWSEVIIQKECFVQDMFWPGLGRGVLIIILKIFKYLNNTDWHQLRYWEGREEFVSPQLARMEMSGNQNFVFNE